MFKARILSLLLVGSIGTSAPAIAEQADPPRQNAPAATLADIQRRIGAARLASVASGDVAPLQTTAAGLRQADAGRGGPAAYYLPYWLAYTDYLIANAQLKTGRKDEAARALAEASTKLTGLAGADAETYALLSLVEGLRIAVASPDQIGEAIGRARDALEKAVAADGNNVRVLYARALADYTTPRQYGGGRAAERLARSAIARPRESDRSLKPGWGRDDSAALLVRILRADGRGGEAQAILTRFVADYPGSAPLRAVSETSRSS